MINIAVQHIGMDAAISIIPESQAQETFFAEVLLPIPVPQTFTYRVPITLNTSVGIGQRVIVQFGKKKILTGLISSLHQNAPQTYEAKYILEVLDEAPLVCSQQFKIIQWMSGYYMCTAGEVLNAMLPSGLKLSSESMVALRPGFDLEDAEVPFSDNELLLLQSLQRKTLSYTEVSKLLDIKNIYSIIKSLVSKEAIVIFEEVKEKYKQKTEKRIRLSKSYLKENALQKIFEELSASAKQEEVLLKFLQEVPVMQNPASNQTGISKKILLQQDISESSLNTLIKKGIFESFDAVVSRFEIYKQDAREHIKLSAGQQKVLEEVLHFFQSKDACLLHGVTGSGKTELYIELINRALEGGSQVLYLLPEIALTTQIVSRLKKVFGDKMGVYHSKFSDNERVEVWNGIINGRFRFVVGVRSAIFLPFDDLSLIIVDEEHDASYKQQDPAPRYQARDVALMMGHIHKAKVLLGSATPSLESYFLAKNERIGYVRLKERYGDAVLPDLVLADLKLERKSKTLKNGFSKTLLQGIQQSLDNKEQVIIFQNRRGYSPTISCEDCEWIPQCINCSVSLTYHQYKSALVCHYCGYKESLPQQCPSCSSARIKTVGYGTEKLEEELKFFFPEAKIQRMDLETTRTKSSYEHIIENFAEGDTDILVGTQMVTKGLDFDRVSLVGVFDADRMMHFPDFRSHERAFQLLTQVSGRSGRRNKKGKVIIQTNNPAHSLLRYVVEHNFEGFYQQQFADRQQYHYPPYYRLINVTLKHRDAKVCRDAALMFFRLCADSIGKEIRIFGPGEPMISKIKNLYIRQILVKIKRDSKSLTEIKQQLNYLSMQMLKEKTFSQCRIIFDVDPG